MAGNSAGTAPDVADLQLVLHQQSYRISGECVVRTFGKRVLAVMTMAGLWLLAVAAPALAEEVTPAPVPAEPEETKPFYADMPWGCWVVLILVGFGFYLMVKNAPDTPPRNHGTTRGTKLDPDRPENRR
jgi:hypothetical protein